MNATSTHPSIIRLLHGSNAGVNYPDELVTFIVRYSSDRVREVIRYIPELDDDEPNRTWKAAQEQMLLLYESSDKERRVSERELIEFCRDQSAKSPYRSKAEIEQYLRSFQLLAAPLLKQRDITIAQRDFYFVSGIRTEIKNWFIERVPEPQRTRSNPISLTDSLGILYGYFDPDALFPDLWTDIDNSPEPAAPISRPTAPPTPYTSSIPSFQAAYTPLHPDIRIPTTSALTALEPDAKSSAPPKNEFSSSPTLSETQGDAIQKHGAAQKSDLERSANLNRDVGLEQRGRTTTPGLADQLLLLAPVKRA
ncbi:hypothetical protein B0H13DRAFT_2535523 [Mycena leptocephala]|nr:hypothetical protein B0H13DRAFT_2535523 [Mycena leptocephala]